VKRLRLTVFLLSLAALLAAGALLCAAGEPAKAKAKAKAAQPKAEPAKAEPPKKQADDEPEGAKETPVEPKGQRVTDKMVREAIEAGRQYLLGTAGGGGVLAPNSIHGSSGTAMAFMTLAYMGEHPNRPQMSATLDHLLNVSTDTGFGGRQGYAAPIATMGFAYIYHKLLGEKRDMVRLKMYEFVNRFVTGQAVNGGWRYLLAGGTNYDLSNTQWPVLAFWEANKVGIEFPPETLRKTQQLYFENQNGDGGWCYTKGKDSYGSMTAGGVASLFIINDVLDPAAGCPCAGGRSQLKTSEAERRMDHGLQWLGKHFTAATNPGKESQHLYWLYSAERVGIAAGFKYFGNHNWYREGAEVILRKQTAPGRWGGIPDTCFALLFLYKGRAPILFNKLQFDGIWNAHRRDIANLTTYIEHSKEQPFHWQIVELERSTLDELHDAPILYICAEQIGEKAFTDAHKKKLRAFTDTGGTILFEASCGNAAMRKWFTDFAKEVWPEWPLKPLGPDHGCFTDPNPLKARPEILGINDGVRTSVFYAMDDISCSWQTRALASRDYLFKWGINLYTYATDGSPLRAKLADRAEEKIGDRAAGQVDRSKKPVRAGPRSALKIARVSHGGNWEAGANYGGFRTLAQYVKDKAGITLQVQESRRTPVTEAGVPVGMLSGYNAAFITGSTAWTLQPQEKVALKEYVDKGGLLWFEAATGSRAFEESLRQLAAEMKWELRLLPKDHPLMTGRLDPGLGYDLTTGVRFSTWFSKQRLGRSYAEFFGVFAGDKMIGVYSPLDILYSITGYESWRSRGYSDDDAAAVATNLLVYLSTQK